MVSIVLPVFNGERYLRESLESCLAQTYADLEVVAVDDGSSDSTPAILAEYAARDPRVQLVTHTRNHGLPRALNTGFAAATGKYFTWTSADNYFRPQAIRVLADALDGWSDVDVVFSDQSFIDSEGNWLSTWTVSDHREMLSPFGPGTALGACFLYRRVVHEILGPYSEELFMVEDFDFFLRASARFRMAVIHKDLYAYRSHAGSLTARFPERIQRLTDLALERNLPQLGWASAQEKASVYLNLARRAQQQREWRRAWRNGLAALRVAPLTTVSTLAERAWGYWRCRLRGEDPEEMYSAR